MLESCSSGVNSYKPAPSSRYSFILLILFITSPSPPFGHHPLFCYDLSLQSALGVQDLGQFYHMPTKDNNGSIVFTTVNYVRDPKVVTSTHVRWVSLGKVQRRTSAADQESPAVPEMLLNSVPVSISHEYLCFIEK